jgi:hypothetical protein
MKTLFTLLTMLSLLSAPAYPQCGGAAPTVTAASVHNVTTDGKLNFYQIAATVKNAGTSSQNPRTLQFVDIYQFNEKLDAKGVPPLARGGTYTVLYTMKRSVEAGKGTSYLTFKLEPACDSSQGTYAFVF